MSSVKLNYAKLFRITQHNIFTLEGNKNGNVTFKKKFLMLFVNL